MTCIRRARRRRRKRHDAQRRRRQRRGRQQPHDGRVRDAFRGGNNDNSGLIPGKGGGQISDVRNHQSLIRIESIHQILEIYSNQFEIKIYFEYFQIDSIDFDYYLK